MIVGSGKLRDVVPVESWPAIEDKLVKFPNDYKHFLSTYGSGCIDGFVYVFNPVVSEGVLALCPEIKGACWALRERAKYDDEFRYPIFPDKPGLLPFAGTDNGDTIMWFTEGEPNSWPVCALEARGPLMEWFNGGLYGLIGAIHRKGFQSGLLPTAEELEAAQPYFRPLE